MRPSTLVVLGVFLALLALTVSPVFMGGLGGYVDVHIPVPRLVYPNNTQGGGVAPQLNSSVVATRVHINVSLTQPPVGVVVGASKGLSATWWLYLAVLGVLVALSLFMVYRRGSGGVYDISSALRELEEASKRFSRSYGPAKMGAIVEYYRRLREVCLQLGVVEGASEAPSEFLDRVALTLGLDRGDARVFAEVFSRARYSQGMSAEEEAASSRFMAHFLDVVRGRVGFGSKA